MTDLTIPESRKALTAALTGIGLCASYSNQLVNGRRTPSLALALEIEDRIGIPPAHWIERAGKGRNKSKAAA